MQTYRCSTAIDWLDSTRLIDLRFLNQNGIFYDVFWVPTVIVKDLRAVACLASWQLVCQCIFVGLMRLVPLFCNITVVIFSPLNGMEKNSTHNIPASRSKTNIQVLKQKLIIEHKLTAYRIILKNQGVEVILHSFIK